VLQTFYRQLHNPGYQQCKSIGRKKKAPPGGITQAERNKILFQKSKFFNTILLLND
jgi:hypothetical protein